MSYYQINPLKIDWNSESSFVFFNEKHSKKKLFLSSIPHLPCLKSHIWLATSGRTCQKWVALSKEAVLFSAQAVNQHLSVTSADRWGVCLPLFHIGGLSILARAHLSRSSYFIYKKKWLVKDYSLFLKEHKITITSLVPTQVYDLVKAHLSCPPFLKTVVVGGAYMSKTLYQEAKSLGWPLLPSYGLTECASQVATASLDSLNQTDYPRLQVLPHVNLKIVSEKIVIQSRSLLTGFIPLSGFAAFQDPKQDRWYCTEDKGILEKGLLEIDNSPTDTIKILGEKVNLKDLREELMGILLKNKNVSGRYFLFSVPDERSGFQIALVTDVFDDQTSQIISAFNRKVSSFEKIQQFYFVPSLPLTDISKISQTALWKILGFCD